MACDESDPCPSLKLFVRLNTVAGFDCPFACVKFAILHAGGLLEHHIRYTLHTMHPRAVQWMMKTHLLPETSALGPEIEESSINRLKDVKGEIEQEYLTRSNTTSSRGIASKSL